VSTLEDLDPAELELADEHFTTPQEAAEAAAWRPSTAGAAARILVLAVIVAIVIAIPQVVPSICRST